MLGVAGVVGFVLLLRSPRAGGRSPPSSCFTPVVINGMFPGSTPWLDIAIGVGIITIFILTIVRAGLLSAIAALFTHFVLLRAPITTDFSSWHAPIGIWHVGVVLAAGLGACYYARNGDGETRQDFLTLTRIGVPIEPERLAQLVRQKSLVGKVKLGRDVREEHERRRRHARLRGVENPDVPLAGADRGVRRGHVLQKAVELAGRHALQTRVGHLVDHLEHLGRPLAGGRRNVEHGRIVEELDLPPQLVVELLGEVLPRPFIRSHLLAAMMMPLPAFSASPAIVAS